MHSLARRSYPELAHIPLGEKGYRLTFSPDSRWAFVALADGGRVAVVDTQTKEVVGHFEIGDGPKRNLVIDADMRVGVRGGESQGYRSANARRPAGHR